MASLSHRVVYVQKLYLTYPTPTSTTMTILPKENLANNLICFLKAANNRSVYGWWKATSDIPFQ